MDNIVLTNNKDLRLVGIKVGVLSTLRIELPLVDASATNVEVIVTAGTVHNAYSASYNADTKRWACDIAASQFPATGKQQYEVAYKLGGKQFWDGKGWIEITEATTSGLTPTPSPVPSRYVVVTVNGYGAPNADGAVRIPKVTIGTEEPSATTGYIECDQFFNRTTGEQWVLCSVTGTLAWVKCAGGGSGGGGVIYLTIDNGYAKKDGVTITPTEIVSLVQSGKIVALISDGIVYNYVYNNDTSATFSTTPSSSLGITYLCLISTAGRAIKSSTQFASYGDVVNASGFKSTRNGATIQSGTTLLPNSLQYYNISGGCRLMLPSTNEINVGNCHWLIHLADGVNASGVTFYDSIHRTIVTNNSSTAYAGSITGDKIGLNQAWKMVTMRIFKNPQGEDFVYLEV